MRNRTPISLPRGLHLRVSCPAFHVFGATQQRKRLGTGALSSLCVGNNWVYSRPRGQLEGWAHTPKFSHTRWETMRLARVCTRILGIKAIWSTSQLDTEFSPMSPCKYVRGTSFPISELIKSRIVVSEFAFQAAVYSQCFPSSPGPGDEVNVSFSCSGRTAAH